MGVIDVPKNVRPMIPPFTPIFMENAKGLADLMTPKVAPAVPPATAISFSIMRLNRWVKMKLTRCEDSFSDKNWRVRVDRILHCRGCTGRY